MIGGNNFVMNISGDSIHMFKSKHPRAKLSPVAHWNLWHILRVCLGCCNYSHHFFFSHALAVSSINK